MALYLRTVAFFIAKMKFGDNCAILLLSLRKLRPQDSQSLALSLRGDPGHWPSLLTLGLMPRWLLDQSTRENNELPVHSNILECLPPRYCYFLWNISYHFKFPIIFLFRTLFWLLYYILDKVLTGDCSAIRMFFCVLFQKMKFLTSYM